MGDCVWDRYVAYHHAKFTLIGDTVAEISLSERIERITADFNFISDKTPTSVASRLSTKHS